MKNLINKKWISASPISIFMVLAISVVPLSAFEAHVVNVTAKIERRPCVLFETRSYGFWKNHPEVRTYPQTLGADTIENDAEADGVFDLPNNIMMNKLKKQLLALKFNVSFYNSGTALAPGSTTTVNNLIYDADLMLIADPPFSNSELEMMKNMIESANTAGTLSTCPDGGGGGEGGDEDDNDGDDEDDENGNGEDHGKDEEDHGNNNNSNSNDNNNQKPKKNNPSNNAQSSSQNTETQSTATTTPPTATTTTSVATTTPATSTTTGATTDTATPPAATSTEETVPAEAQSEEETSSSTPPALIVS